MSFLDLISEAVKGKIIPPTSPRHPLYKAPVSEPKKSGGPMSGTRKKTMLPKVNPVTRQHLDNAISSSYPDVEPYDKLATQFPHLHRMSGKSGSALMDAMHMASPGKDFNKYHDSVMKQYKNDISEETEIAEGFNAGDSVSFHHPKTSYGVFGKVDSTDGDWVTVKQKDGSIIKVHKVLNRVKSTGPSLKKEETNLHELSNAIIRKALSNAIERQKDLIKKGDYTNAVKKGKQAVFVSSKAKLKEDILSEYDTFISEYMLEAFRDLDESPQVLTEGFSINDVVSFLVSHSESPKIGKEYFVSVVTLSGVGGQINIKTTENAVKLVNEDSNSYKLSSGKMHPIKHILNNRGVVTVLSKSQTDVDNMCLLLKMKYANSDNHITKNTLEESRKKVGEYSHTNGHSTKVYHLTGEHDEGDPYHVKLFRNGKHYEPADYFTNDKDDAHSTAQHMVKKGVETLDEAGYIPPDRANQMARDQRNKVADAARAKLATILSIRAAKGQEPDPEDEKKNVQRDVRESSMLPMMMSLVGQRLKV